MWGTSHAAKLAVKTLFYALAIFISPTPRTPAMRPNDSFIKPKLPKALLDQIGGDSSNNKKNAPPAIEVSPAASKATAAKTSSTATATPCLLRERR